MKIICIVKTSILYCSLCISLVYQNLYATTIIGGPTSAAEMVARVTAAIAQRESGEPGAVKSCITAMFEQQVQLDRHHIPTSVTGPKYMEGLTPIRDASIIPELTYEHSVERLCLHMAIHGHFDDSVKFTTLEPSINWPSFFRVKGMESLGVLDPFVTHPALLEITNKLMDRIFDTCIRVEEAPPGRGVSGIVLLTPVKALIDGKAFVDPNFGVCFSSPTFRGSGTSTRLRTKDRASLSIRQKDMAQFQLEDMVAGTMVDGGDPSVHGVDGSVIQQITGCVPVRATHVKLQILFVKNPIYRFKIAGTMTAKKLQYAGPHVDFQSCMLEVVK